MSAPQLIPQYIEETHYGQNFPESFGMYRQMGNQYWEAVAEQYPDDAVGTRRLAWRTFQDLATLDRPLCYECVITRVPESRATSGWQFDTVLFFEGDVSPYPWHIDNRPTPFEYGGQSAARSFLETRHQEQNELSRIQ